MRAYMVRSIYRKPARVLLPWAKIGIHSPIGGGYETSNSFRDNHRNGTHTRKPGRARCHCWSDDKNVVRLNSLAYGRRVDKHECCSAQVRRETSRSHQSHLMRHPRLRAAMYPPGPAYQRSGKALSPLTRLLQLPTGCIRPERVEASVTALSPRHTIEVKLDLRHANP